MLLSMAHAHDSRVVCQVIIDLCGSDHTAMRTNASNCAVNRPDGPFVPNPNELSSDLRQLHIISVACQEDMLARYIASSAISLCI